MATIDEQGRQVIFDPNEKPGDWASGKSMALFPRVHEALSGFVHDIDTYVAAMAKAITPPPTAFVYAQISYMPDVANAGLMSWPGIPPDSLRKIARENIAPQLILQNRVLDVRRYAGKSQHPWKPGWRIELMDGGRHPSKSELRDIRSAERFITNCNLETAYSDARTRDSEGHGRVTAFSDFLAAGIYDSLRFDGWAIWTDMAVDGRIKAFANLAGGNIRLAHPDHGYAGDPKKFAALLDETGTPAASFTRDELTWRVRNPRTDPGILGYGLSELEQGIRLVQGFQSAIDLNVDTFCYTEDTEVLTKSGWKRFDVVDTEQDSFATLNLSDGAFEYQRATAHTWADYDGDVYKLKSRSVDLVVTPDHRVITQYRPAYLTTGETTYTVVLAKDLHAKLQDMKPASRTNYCLPMMSSWRGTEIGEKSFIFNPPQYESTRSISGDDYCAFMGMWLAEGNLAKDKDAEAKNNIVVHQQKSSKGFKPFSDLLTKILGKEPRYDNESWFKFGWRGLAEHLSQFGSGCYDKQIPQEILNATARQQKLFWDYYSLGDGCITGRLDKRTGNISYQEHIATTSLRMADQLQELAQKMGYAATVLTVDAEKYNDRTDGRPIYATTPRYDVYLKTSPMHSIDTEKTCYKGKIGCVTVPNGTLYVRRNGKAAWCGNSTSAIPNGILLLKGDFWTAKQIDFATREWQNLKKGQSKVWGLPVMGVPEKGDVEILALNDLKGTDVRYKDHMNMMVGALSALYGFPPRRLGYKISGQQTDSAPLPDQSTQEVGDDDPGLAPLLLFIEDTINPYLLWPNWPHLRFVFSGKNPKEDAREVESQKLARTWQESRAQVDLPPLEDGVPAEIKPLMELMAYCPEDPAKMGAFQTLASIMLEDKLGVNDQKDGATPGAPMKPKKDAAESESHGGTAGVRRNSRAESKKD